MRIAVITDIHGYYSKLKNALRRADELGYDKIYFLGDYFDRAYPDDSKLMIDWLIEHYNDNDKRFIYGNHDEWIHRYLNGKMQCSEENNWRSINNGGYQTIEAISHTSNKNKQRLLDIYDDMPLFIQHGRDIFSHSGVNLNDLKKDKVEVSWSTLWGAPALDSYMYNGLDYILHTGHIYAWLADPSVLNIKVPYNWFDITNSSFNWDNMPGKSGIFRLYDTGSCINELIDINVSTVEVKD